MTRTFGTHGLQFLPLVLVSLISSRWGGGFDTGGLFENLCESSLHFHLFDLGVFTLENDPGPFGVFLVVVLWTQYISDFVVDEHSSGVGSLHRVDNMLETIEVVILDFI